MSRRRYFMFTVLLVGVLAAPAAWAEDALPESEVLQLFPYLRPPEPDPAMHPAERRFLEGKWLQAAKEYQTLAKSAQDPAHYRRLGEAYLYAGEYKDAKKAFGKALSLSNDNDLYSACALIAIEAIEAKGDKKTASYERLASHEADFGQDARYWRLFGLALLRNDAFNPALGYFERAVELDPDDYMSNFFIGIVHELRLDFDKAMLPYKRSVEANPVYIQAINNLGYNYKERHYYSYAKPHYERAIELDPGNAGYHYNLGNIHNHWKETERANALYRKAVALDPKFHKAHYNLGKTSTRMGYLDEGIRELKLYIKYWKPGLSERDVPRPEEVKEMIRDVEDMKADREQIEAIEDPEERAYQMQRQRERELNFFGGARD